jgi:hypothetical protein
MIMEEIEKQIKHIAEEGININNLENLCKLAKTKNLLKECESMRYRYGEYNDYGRRGYDRKYRGNDYLNEMGDSYERYSDYRESYNRGYGAKEDTIRPLEHMLEAVVDFVKMLKEDAGSQEEVELIRKYTRKISEM